MKLELLAPAKNLELGQEAINHGADAVYIGAPAFGARQAATNSLGDVEALIRYAHTYGAKVFATVNTLLRDDELEAAVKMIEGLYEAGTDALIVQDIGLLQCPLPPIELHASTQCHNVDVERIKFLESAGFSRVILARETSLEQMRAIRQATSMEMEAFVHGALCVSYSGQCYMSLYLNDRSGNRGVCSQPCRSAYDLLSADGRTLMRDSHLLSLKDFNASQALGSMIDAGVCSFKIEGRLKDLGYVKNVTAHYRRLLDSLMEGHERASSGRTELLFEPDVEKTFNRGYTTYFLYERQPMASPRSPKSIGKYVGKVTTVGSYTLTVDGDATFANGDGLCFVGSDGKMHGFLVNNANGHTLTPNTMPSITAGTPLWRNNDMQFEHLLKGNTATRKIGVRMTFCATKRGFSLDITDEDGVSIAQYMKAEHTPAQSQQKQINLITKQLSKLGNTPYVVERLMDATEGAYFVPALALNQLRRDAVELLTQARLKHFRPVDKARTDSHAPYPSERADYRANIVNAKAEEFYKNHGVKEIERGLEQTGSFEGRALMTTKYCLRYELGCCLQGKSKGKAQIDAAPTDTLLLRNNERRFRLHFDCAKCQMEIYKA